MLTGGESLTEDERSQLNRVSLCVLVSSFMKSLLRFRDGLWTLLTQALP